MPENGLVGLVDQGVFLPLAALAALVMGAAHACAPGHGKTLTAGYLVGGRGRMQDAVLVGFTVAGMHTVSVVVLGVLWWSLAAAAPDLEVVTSWLQLLAAALVVAVGVGLLRRHAQAHGGHEHEHEHGHEHGHEHARPDGSLLSRRGLVLLGTSGGLLPSPSAFLVLLTGLLTGHVLVAAVLLACFGLGLGATLAAVGVAVLRGRDLLLTRLAGSPRLRAWGSRLPFLTASGVLFGGVLLATIAAARI